MENRSVYQDLLYLQENFKSKKDQRNDFGKYNYRSLETMLPDLKPLLKEINCVLLFNEELLGECGYMKCTVTLQRADGSACVKTSTIIKMDDSLKGLSYGQMTGASLSYARKYALCGLLAVCEDKDLDSYNFKSQPQQTFPQDITEKINACSTLSELSTLWGDLTNEEKNNARIKARFSAKKKLLKEKNM